MEAAPSAVSPTAERQPDAPNDTIREIRQLARLAFIIAVFLLGGIGLWSAIATLNGAVIASGVIKVDTDPKFVQHETGGVVRKILVREGQQVAAGDVLFELEDIQAGAALGSVNDQLAADMAKIARLEAENSGAKHVRFPEALLARRAEPQIALLLERESALFQARSRLYADQTQGLQAQQKELLSEQQSLERRIKAADESLDYLDQQLGMFETLQTKGFVSSARLIEIKRAKSEKQESRLEYEMLRSQAAQKLVDAGLRLSQLRESRVTDNARDIVELQARINEMHQRERPLQDSMTRRLVRAPASGIVNAIRVTTEGGVVRPGETILEITPNEVDRLAEVKVNPADIEQVRQDQDVELEFAGLNRRVTPLVAGKVAFVSSDLIRDQANPQIQYFNVRVVLTPAEPLNFAIKAGMPVTAFITTQERTPLEIWLDPIIGGLRRTLREN